MTRRTKLIIGAVFTVSLACNFFFLGWLVGASPLVPRPWVGHLSAIFRPGPDPNLSPELRVIDFLTRDLSEAGRRKILDAVESRNADLHKLERQAAAIRADVVALMLQPQPNQADIEKRLQDYQQTLHQRLAVITKAILPALLALGMEDRQIFVESWARGPGGPPPPPPPHPD